MIDLSKQYRTKCGLPVFGLFQEGVLTIGYFKANDNHLYACKWVSETGEIDEWEDLAGSETDDLALVENRPTMKMMFLVDVFSDGSVYVNGSMIREGMGPGFGNKFGYKKLEFFVEQGEGLNTDDHV